MSRARKDSQGNSLPVVNHRKQIGKQEYKKSKPHLKKVKQKAENKENASSVYKDISLMVGVMLAVIFSVYVIVYILISDSSN